MIVCYLFSERVFRNQSRQLPASQRRKEEESLGVYAADVQLMTQRGYPEFPAAAREALALHAFLRGLVPECLGQHVRLTEPQTLDAALDQAVQAECSAPLQQNLVGASMEVVPDHTPRTSSSYKILLMVSFKSTLSSVLHFLPWRVTSGAGFT